jgi:hypothetical protein
MKRRRVCRSHEEYTRKIDNDSEKISSPGWVATNSESF